MSMASANPASGEPPFYWGDGSVDEHGDLYIVSNYPDDEDAEPFTRMWMYRDGLWTYHDLPTAVKSVLRVAHPLLLIALGRDGLVSVGTSAGFSTEVIPDAGTGAGRYGYLNRVRGIGKDIYACGVSGQVYKRTGSAWVHMDDGLLRQWKSISDAVDLYDIDGTDANNIYAAGLEGFLAHWDGQRWTELERPTNWQIERVLCASQSEVYLAGGGPDESLLFIGNKDDGWHSYVLPVEGGFFGMTLFQGTLFLSTDEALWSFKNGAFTEVRPILNRPIHAYYRLEAGGPYLYAIGETDLVRYDGTAWERVAHPDW